MKFRNPWIDPRITQVRSASAEAYLLRKGWKPLPAEQQHFLPFEGPSAGNGNVVVQVPTLEQGRDYVQRVIELISDVALAEDRYAVDVLTEVLQEEAAPHPAANGPATPQKTEPAAR